MSPRKAATAKVATAKVAPAKAASAKLTPKKVAAGRQRKASVAPSLWPAGVENVRVQVAGKEVALTNLGKLFWPELGITKGDLIQYYATVAPVLLPHLRDRAMVMKRYPHGAHGEFFFMKRAPSPRPDWIEICSIEHGSRGVIDFPMIQDLPALLWVINLGCIDLNPWYARCDDIDRPDFLHFDLDPVAGTGFAQVKETALVLKDALDALGMPSYPKTTGSKGIHVYVPIERGPRQKEVWTFAKALANTLEGQRPDLVTAEYRIAKRPKGRVLVDYNQNAWGRTLASIYSVRPRSEAPVSMPVTWKEVASPDLVIEDFRLDNAAARIARNGDLWAPLVAPSGRVKLERFLETLR
jgi:bifunctional non-homologous end joining protein LigD